MDMGIVWFIAVAVFLMIEAATYQMVSIYFAVGAVGGLIAYLLGAGTYIQLVIFIAVSAVLIVLLRPISMKMLKNRDKDAVTNTDTLIGRNVYITEEVNNIKESGQGKINGNYWTVRSTDNSVIPAGSVAEIEKIEGVKLIVKEN